MGSKYVPSIKDLRAGRRFQQKQHTQSKFIKPAPKPPAAKANAPKPSKPDAPGQAPAPR